MEVPAPEHPLEPIVLDGSNIVHRHGVRAGGLAHLEALHDALVAADWTPWVVVDASLRHRLAPEEQEALEQRLMDGWHQVPKGHDADVEVLRAAERLDAVVVSADRFRDHPRPPRRRIDPGDF